MGLKFYIDHNVHGGITQGLRQRGIDCLTCADDGTERADDDVVLQRALELSRIVFTQDTDFLRITTKWLQTSRQFAGVPFAEQMGVTIGQAVRDLEIIAETLTESEMMNQVWLLPI